MADLPAPFYGVDLAVLDKKIYFAVGDSPADDVYHQVYVYDVDYNQLDQLPPSGHYYGIPHIIGRKLAIIGGRLSANNKRTNKVSTFDEDSQTWTSYYPDLLSIRSRPGVTSHLEHVIVAGGTRAIAEDDDTKVLLDDIEILNWIENSHWRKVSIKLPVPMYAFTPTISDGDLLIVGFGGPEIRDCRNCYKIPVSNIIASTYKYTFAKWTELTATDHYFAAIVPSSSPPVVVGGNHINTTMPTADIKMYDNTNKSWKRIGSLSSARSHVTVAVIYNNAIIVIGGCKKSESMASCKSSSLTVMELGQAKLYY